ncbi:MAG: hypothetical protein WBL28_04840 [Methylotenera sp.]
MKWAKWLENWDMTSLKISAPFLEMEWRPQVADMNAAWELYIELLTRTATQPLGEEDGDEKTALDSIHSLFAITRQVLKDNSKDCKEFSKIAIVVLNQVVRPFTAKWHRLSLQGAFNEPEKCKDFRIDLNLLQMKLSKFSKMLAEMAGVEDLTGLYEK